MNYKTAFNELSGKIVNPAELHDAYINERRKEASWLSKLGFMLEDFLGKSEPDWAELKSLSSITKAIEPGAYFKPDYYDDENVADAAFSKGHIGAMLSKILPSDLDNEILSADDKKTVEAVKVAWDKVADLSDQINTGYHEPVKAKMEYHMQKAKSFAGLDA